MQPHIPLPVSDPYARWTLSQDGWHAEWQSEQHLSAHSKGESVRQELVHRHPPSACKSRQAAVCLMAFPSLHPLSSLQEDNRGAFRERVLTQVIYKRDLTVASTIDYLEILRDCSIRESSSASLANLLITFSPPIYLFIYFYVWLLANQIII